MVVLRTHPGTAASVAYAVDFMHWPEVLGSIAGDDTVFIAAADKEAVNALIKRLIGTDHVGEEYSEMEVSAIKEMGNIITGAYLNSISTLTNLTIYPSVPDMAIDMAGSILSVPAAEFGVIGDKMLLIQTSFSNEIDFSGYFILVPDEGSYARILGSLGF